VSLIWFLGRDAGDLDLGEGLTMARLRWVLAALLLEAMTFSPCLARRFRRSRTRRPPERAGLAVSRQHQTSPSFSSPRPRCDLFDGQDVARCHLVLLAAVRITANII